MLRRPLVAANPWTSKKGKGGVTRVTWPRKICELNANTSVTDKATAFKFGVHVFMDNTDMAAEK